MKISLSRLISRPLANESKSSMQTQDFINYLKSLKSTDWELKATEEWTVKDMVAHLVGWEKANAEAASAALETNKDPVWLEVEDEDSFNAESVKFYKAYSSRQLLEEWENWQVKLNEITEKISQKNYQILFNWLAESKNHKEHHFQQIKKLIIR